MNTDDRNACRFSVNKHNLVLNFTMQELSDCYNVCVYFQRVTPDMAEFLEELRTRVRVGLVGGSDLCKIKEQLGDDGEAHTSYPSQLSIPQARHQCDSFFLLCVRSDPESGLRVC